ncbi:alpha/beta hydrolase [Brytella acorum]
MIERRRLMAGTFAAAFCAGGSSADARSEIPWRVPVWPGQPPGGGGPEGQERVSRKGSVTNVVVPTLTVLRPMNPTGSAILIAGGGGYKHIENGTEAMPSARWLASIGITAFVLTYRLPREGWRAGARAPLQDAERAIRVIRGQSASLGIDPRKVGVLGFSAGGHLLGMETVLASRLSYQPVDALDRISGNPDFSLLIYPIVTLEPPFQDTSTRRVLIGEDPNPVESVEWSVQTHVHPGLAPFFLVQAADDPISNPANTAILQAACERNGVDVDRHLFPTGGHGFGLGRPGTETVDWPRMAEAWMAKRHFL